MAIEARAELWLQEIRSAGVYREPGCRQGMQHAQDETSGLPRKPSPLGLRSDLHESREGLCKSEVYEALVHPIGLAEGRPPLAGGFHVLQTQPTGWSAAELATASNRAVSEWKFGVHSVRYASRQQGHVGLQGKRGWAFRMVRTSYHAKADPSPQHLAAMKPGTMPLDSGSA